MAEASDPQPTSRARDRESRLNFRQLQIFHAVMRTGSVTGAARLLRISQPAVSKALRLMQGETGLPLLVRDGARLRPSAEAEQIYGRAREIFLGIEDLDHFVAELRDLRAGRLRIAALSTLAAAFVPEAVARLHRERPQVQVEVTALPSAQVLDLVVRNEVDLGFFHAPAKDPKVRSEEICETEIVCILPKGHPAARKRQVRPHDLSGETIITFQGDTSVGWMLKEAFRREGSRVEAPVLVNQTFVAFSLVAEGVGVALVDPFPAFGKAFADLVVRPFRPAMRLRPRLAFPVNRPESRLARAFADQLKQVCREREGETPFRLRMLS